MFLRGQVSTACDVYSYGILLWEIIMHKIPFADTPPLVAALAAADNEKVCYITTYGSLQVFITRSTV